MTLRTMKTEPRQVSRTSDPRRILVPVDFSPSSRVALEHALGIARRNDAQLTLLHVVEPFDASLLMDPAEARRIARADANEQLSKLAGPIVQDWPRTGRELRAGNPATTIVAMARRMKADLIVMGTHGRTGLKRMVIGSVAERVVRLAHCSVLVVR